MKIAVICNTDSLAIPAISYLQEQGLLAGVGILKKNAAQLVPALMSTGIAGGSVCLFEKEGWKETMTGWLGKISADMVWVFAFPWKIPAAILEIPVKGFFNFHFGLLPRYKGADPIFWQLKNREEKGGLVVHRMTAEVDEGPVVARQEVPMFAGETYGLHCQRMGQVAVQVVTSLLQQLREDKVREEKQPAIAADWYHKPGEKELTVSWYTQDAEEIHALVNASNPRYGGVSAFIRGMEWRILEVTPADLKDVPAAGPGTIVYADMVYGLIVACKDKSYLRINIVQTREGYLSGVKLHSMGIRAGEQFINNQPTVSSI